MSGALVSEGGGGPVATCTRCGAIAVGPCASCRLPVCGDCCVLTEGGARVWAICFACEDRRGRSLRRAWVGFVAWIAVPIVGLLVIVVALQLLFGR